MGGGAKLRRGQSIRRATLPGVNCGRDPQTNYNNLEQCNALLLSVLYCILFWSICAVLHCDAYCSVLHYTSCCAAIVQIAPMVTTTQSLLAPMPSESKRTTTAKVTLLLSVATIVRRRRSAPTVASRANHKLLFEIMKRSQSSAILY